MLTGVGAGRASLCTGTQLTLYISLFMPLSLVNPPQHNILHLEHSSFTDKMYRRAAQQLKSGIMNKIIISKYQL